MKSVRRYRLPAEYCLTDKELSNGTTTQTFIHFDGVNVSNGYYVGCIKFATKEAANEFKATHNIPDCKIKKC